MRADMKEPSELERAWGAIWSGIILGGTASIYLLADGPVGRKLWFAGVYLASAAFLFAWAWAHRKELRPRCRKCGCRLRMRSFRLYEPERDTLCRNCSDENCPQVGQE